MTVANELFAAFVNVMEPTFEVKVKLSPSGSNAVMLNVKRESSVAALLLIASNTGSLFVFVTVTVHIGMFEATFELLSVTLTVIM